MDELHERVCRVGLRAIEDDGFVLAGGYAVRAHGIGERPSEDVDLFTNTMDPERFAGSVDKLVHAYRDDGLEATVKRRAPLFARIEVTDDRGASADIDLGVDYRRLPPSRLEIGPVLSQEDAVANKVGAMYTRSEARDAMDLQAILDSGRYRSDQLLDLGDQRESAPLDREIFAGQLRAAGRLPDAAYAAYGADPEQITRIRETMVAWSNKLVAEVRNPEIAESTRTAEAGVAPAGRASGGQVRTTEAARGNPADGRDRGGPEGAGAVSGTAVG
jgi:Nucleotidyl transferase AbiEii toxin, Type IV TA system